MNTLCITAKLSSAELAAWVQAIGSILAIIAAFLVAILQSRFQHKNALALRKEEKRDARLEITRTLLTLARNCAKAVAFISAKLSNREAIHNIAVGIEYLDIGELQSINTYLLGIPLHSLPDILVSPVMIINSTIRQCLAKVEMALKFHREMDSAAFEDLFRVFGEMNESLKATCDDIEAEVKRIQGEI
jgi:hypothetical protein